MTRRRKGRRGSGITLEQLRRLQPDHAVLEASEAELLDWAEDAAEKELQAKCEGYLRHRGYWPRQTQYIEAGPPPTGWYLHLVDAEKNSLLLDLLIIHEATTCTLEVELKTVRGRPTKIQTLLLEQDHRRQLVRSPAALKDVLDAWEAQLAHVHPPADYAGLPVDQVERNDEQNEGGPGRG